MLTFTNDRIIHTARQYVSKRISNRCPTPCSAFSSLENHAHKTSPEQRLYICSALSTQIQNAHSRDEAERLFRRQCRFPHKIEEIKILSSVRRSNLEVKMKKKACFTSFVLHKNRIGMTTKVTAEVPPRQKSNKAEE